MSLKLCCHGNREISELHKARVTHVSEAHKAALDVEISAREQLTSALDECRQQMKREQMVLVTQVNDILVIMYSVHSLYRSIIYIQ